MNAVIKNNVGRKDKALGPRKDGGLIHFKQFDTAFDEAEYIAMMFAVRTEIS